MSKQKKRTAKAPTPAELLASITLADGKPLPPALQASTLREFLSLTQLVSGGLPDYVYRFRELTGGVYVAPIKVLAAYRLAYSDVFGKGEEGDEAELALLLSFLDQDFTPDTIGEALAAYCEQVLNEDGSRPALTQDDFLAIDSEGMHKELGSQLQKYVRECVTELNKTPAKQYTPLPGQQDLPYNDEPEVRVPRFRAPARHKDWTGQRITFKSDSQQRVIGTVSSDIDGRIWFVDEQGKKWGDDVGVDKARCTAVAPVAGANAVSALRKPDLVFALDKEQLRELKAAYKKAANHNTFPGERVFDTGQRFNEMRVQLQLFKGYAETDKPFFQLRAYDGASSLLPAGTSPPFFEPAGTHQLWIYSRNYVVELRSEDAVSV